MDKQKMLKKMGEFGMNLYDAAIMDESGIEQMRYQPSNICNNSYSVAKAFTMTAIGLLQDDGILTTQSRITDFFPEWEEVNPGWTQVTIENALQHRIGFADGFIDVDEDTPSFLADDRNYDYLSIIRDEKLGYAPGSHYAYSDSAFYLLSRIVSKACGKYVDEFLRERLILPLQFGSIAWSRCPLGYPMGATGLFVSARDMVKLGWLYLNDGVYNGKQVVSSQWVKQTIEKGYEFKPVNGTRLIGKGGINCQMVLFSPESKFAAAWHGFTPNKGDREMIDWLAEC